MGTSFRVCVVLRVRSHVFLALSCILRTSKSALAYGHELRVWDGWNLEYVVLLSSGVSQALRRYMTESAFLALRFIPKDRIELRQSPSWSV